MWSGRNVGGELNCGLTRFVDHDCRLDRLHEDTSYEESTRGAFHPQEPEVRLVALSEASQDMRPDSITGHACMRAVPTWYGLGGRFAVNFGAPRTELRG